MHKHVQFNYIHAYNIQYDLLALVNILRVTVVNERFYFIFYYLLLISIIHDL